MMNNLSLDDRMIRSYVFLCVKEGILNVTLQKTAKHAKVPFATAHYHWGGKKKELIVEAITTIGKQAQIYIEEYLNEKAKKSEDPIKSYVKGTFQWIEEHREDAQLWLFFYHHLASGGASPERGKQFILTAQLRVERWLNESVGLGYFKPISRSDTKELAKHIHALVFANGIFAIMSRSGETTREMLRATLKQIQSLSI